MKIDYIKKREELTSLYSSETKESVSDINLVLECIDIENSGHIKIDEDVYVNPVMLSKALKKHRTDFQANYIRTHPGLCEPYIKTIDSATARAINAASKSKGVVTSLRNKSMLITLSLAWRYIKDTARIAYQIQEKTSNLAIQSQGIKDVIYEKGKVYISSYSIAKELNQEHESVITLIQKYMDYILQYGELKKETHIKNLSKDNNEQYAECIYYLLNEDQCYFLGTLSRNSERAVQFKSWLVHQFSNAKKMLSAKYNLLDEEQVYHTELAHLCMYTGHKVQTEYPVEVLMNDKGKLRKGIRRIDLFLDEAVGIELKKGRITSEVVRETIATRGYYHSLKQFPSFRYLILSSPAGITYEAAKLLEVMTPHVIFLSPNEIALRMAKTIIKRYPPSCQWWLGNVVFQQFPHLFSTDDMKEFSNKKSSIWREYSRATVPKLKLMELGEIED